MIGLLALIGIVLYAAFGGDGDARPQVDDADNFYSVIFDAGSTGSRIHVYTFSRASGKLELLDELFEQVKPGLSSYENDIDGGVDSIKQLLCHSIAQLLYDSIGQVSCDIQTHLKSLQFQLIHSRETYLYLGSSSSLL